MTDKILRMRKGAFPQKCGNAEIHAPLWLSVECEQAMRRKHMAQSTHRKLDMMKECSAVFMQHYCAFIFKMRAKSGDAKQSSKSLWSNARQLLNTKSKTSSIRHLKQGSTWILMRKKH